MSEQKILGAFSEQHASALSGLSIWQLREWDRLGFFPASLAAENRRQPYSRVYSFRDLVALRVLNSLKNEHGVSTQHLKEVSTALGGFGADRWIDQTLYVLNKKVVFDDPNEGKRREVVSGQRVFDIPLKVAARDTKTAIRDYNQRPREVPGEVEQHRFTMNNRPVIAGTRILVSAIEDYILSGHSDAEILEEFPSLTLKDIEAIRQRTEDDAA